MAENTSASPTNSTPNKQPNRILLFLIRIKTIIKNIVIKIWSIPRGYFDAFTAEKRQKRPEDEDHALYIKYRPYAESARITIQMLIGVALVIILLIQIIVLIFTYRQNPFSSSFMPNNPLKIIAYGLFFSTGVDLAYMLFTPGPDEAIDPVMTGLAAAILLGVGNISDYSQLQLKHGVILFLAVAALAGLFATKKYLYIHKKEKTNGKNDASSATQEDKAKA